MHPKRRAALPAKTRPPVKAQLRESVPIPDHSDLIDVRWSGGKAGS
jgi:hypothetical protein